MRLLSYGCRIKAAKTRKNVYFGCTEALDMFNITLNIRPPFFFFFFCAAVFNCIYVSKKNYKNSKIIYVLYIKRELGHCSRNIIQINLEYFRSY